MKDVSTTNGITINHSDDWLWKASNLHLQVKYVEAWNTISTYVSAMSLYVHITARAECFVASTSQNDHADVKGFTTVVECL